jgi:hypothetical protein
MPNNSGNIEKYKKNYWGNLIPRINVENIIKLAFAME